MTSSDVEYCEQCRAPWVSGNDFCVQCGHTLMNEGDVHSGPTDIHPTRPTQKLNTAATSMKKPNDSASSEGLRSSGFPRTLGFGIPTQSQNSDRGHHTQHRSSNPGDEVGTLGIPD